VNAAARPRPSNDHVNMSQSSNDTFPTAMHIAAVVEITDRLVPALERLRDALDAKAKAYASITKIAVRTSWTQCRSPSARSSLATWPSSTPIWSACAWSSAALRTRRRRDRGGHGLNTHPEFGERVAAAIAELTGKALRDRSEQVRRPRRARRLVFAHGAIKTTATSLIKIADDLRWLGSGPRSGLGELQLPENEPGSSIMPGKVNPTQSEAMIMVAIQVFGTTPPWPWRDLAGTRTQRLQAGHDSQLLQLD